MHHYTECGLPDVWLANGFTPHPTPYGLAMVVEDVEGLHRAIGRHLVHRRPYLTGREFRFLRKELDLSHNAFAGCFGNDAQSVALWEKRGRTPAWADRFLRAIYSEHMEGNAHIREIVAPLHDLDRHERERQVFEDTPEGWRTAA
jgi:Predicted transcriptional regulator